MLLQGQYKRFIFRSRLTHAGKYARVLRKRRLTFRIHGQQRISDFQPHRVALKEVREIDEPFVRCSVGVRDEFVVGQAEAEDVGVDYDDPARVGAVANDIGVEAVDELFRAFGLAGVDGSL